MLTLLVSALALAALHPGGGTTDWPQYHGSASDRTTAGPFGAQGFPAAGPASAWKVPLGDGFSSFVVQGGRAYTLVGRREEGKVREVLLALDAASGKELWSAPLGALEYDGGGGAGADGNDGGDGPRTTPSVIDGRVYALDANLGLFCFEAAGGKALWQHDLRAEFGGRMIQWQNGASPLVEGELVFVSGGGPDESLLAFDRKTGEVAWARGDEKMTHATPVAATIQGVRQVLFFVQAGLIAVEPSTGAELWRTEFPYRTSTAASPVVSGDIVYCSAGYGVGAAAWRIDKKGAALQPELLWRASNKLINHWSTPVVKDGHLYGMFSFKEYGKGPLKCVELATGTEKWSHDGFGPGNCIRVGDTLVALSDGGEVVLVAADPAGYREHARADVLAGKCWSMPAFSDGALYVRSTREGVRLDLAGTKGQ
jgi:outer membrane protein assembly factor BamB